MLKRIIHIFAILLQIGLIIISLGVLYASIFEKESIKTAIHWIQSQVQLFWAWNIAFAFLSSCVESFPVLGALLPGQNIMIIIGGIYGPNHIFMTITACIVGAIIGNGVGYIIGKQWWHVLLNNYGYLFWLEKTERAILENQVSKNGPWFVVLAKFNNVSRSLIPFLVGAIRMQNRKFWIYNTLGSVIYATTITLIGVFLFDQYETIINNFEKIMLSIIVIFALYIFLYKKTSVKAYVESKKKEWEWSHKE